MRKSRVQVKVPAEDVAAIGVDAITSAAIQRGGEAHSTPSGQMLITVPPYMENAMRNRIKEMQNATEV